jgi:hypothetical protein
MAENDAERAGPHGDYNCDIPVSVFESMVESIKEQNPDVIFWTGDVAPHD